LKVDFQGARVTSDGGLILVRELDERLGLSVLIERHLIDSRRGKNVQLPLSDLLRQSVYSRLAGYEDVNDAERLSQDPTFRHWAGLLKRNHPCASSFSLGSAGEIYPLRNRGGCQLRVTALMSTKPRAARWNTRGLFSVGEVKAGVDALKPGVDDDATLVEAQDIGLQVMNLGL
jgi:Transposase DDE domain group 1